MTLKVHGLSMPEVDEIINSLIQVAEAVQTRFLWRPLLSDPTDDTVLETAVNGRADLLVMFNQGGFRGCRNRFCTQDGTAFRSAALVTDASKQVEEGIRPNWPTTGLASPLTATSGLPRCVG